jgi:hypothetical protein
MGLKKVRVKVDRVEKRDGYYVVRYKYADMKVANAPLYGTRHHGAVDELDALNKFIKCMKEVNYEVLTEEQ